MAPACLEQLTADRYREVEGGPTNLLVVTPTGSGKSLLVMNPGCDDSLHHAIHVSPRSCWLCNICIGKLFVRRRPRLCSAQSGRSRDAAPLGGARYHLTPTAREIIQHDASTPSVRHSFVFLTWRLLTHMHVVAVACTVDSLGSNPVFRLPAAAGRIASIPATH